jgi:hypothetical protein
MSLFSTLPPVGFMRKEEKNSRLPTVAAGKIDGKPALMEQ